jgi:trk system potassium uptake protein TrkH
VFHRAIPIRTLKRALVIVIMYLFMAGLAITVLSITEKVPTFSLLFEVISALSTVGLSLSATAKLTAFGKMVIIFLMIFGRVGLLTIVLAGIGEPEKLAIRYPEDDFVVG